jgi:hypothetical protein
MSHAHTHHDHDHHHHAHPPKQRAGSALSLMRLSVSARLLGASVLAAFLWVAVIAVMQ